MNIQEYISSGIIESYVLGLASPEERIEFEQLCSQYPQLAEARNNFELKLESRAMQGKITPPGHVKQKILSALQQTSASSESKIVKMESMPRRRSSFLSWVAAASIILLFLTGYFAYIFYNQKRALIAKLSHSDSIINKMADDQKMMLKQQELMYDPKVTVVNLVGLKGSPSSANVYWDSTASNVYLVVKNMPLLPSNKQYQLWALIDNKQLNLGSFDAPPDNRVILKMKNTQRADAFAITVENRGNTNGPTLDELKAMGKTKIE